MKKIQQYIFIHLRLNGVSPVFSSVTLTYIFLFQMFKICEIRFFSNVAINLNYEKIQQYRLKHL